MSLTKDGVNYHIHKNGGGKVAETASVSEDVFLGHNCTVHDRVFIAGKVRIEDYVNIYDSVSIIGKDVVLDGSITLQGNSSISGTVKVQGTVNIYHTVSIRNGVIIDGRKKPITLYGWFELLGGVWHREPLVIQGHPYRINEDYEGRISIGCTTYTLEDWRINGPALAKIHNLTEIQKEEYESYLNLFEAHFKRMGVIPSEETVTRSSNTIYTSTV